MNRLAFHVIQEWLRYTFHSSLLEKSVSPAPENSLSIVGVDISSAQYSDRLHLIQSRRSTEAQTRLQYSRVASPSRWHGKHPLTSCRRAAATLCPRPSPHSVGAEGLRAAEPTAAPADGNVPVGSHGEYFPTLTAPAS